MVSTSEVARRLLGLTAAVVLGMIAVAWQGTFL